MTTMKTCTSMGTAILQFAFCGVFGPHRMEGEALGYEAPRVVSTSERVFIERRG